MTFSMQKFIHAFEILLRLFYKFFSIFLFIKYSCNILF